MSALSFYIIMLDVLLCLTVAKFFCFSFILCRILCSVSIARMGQDKVSLSNVCLCGDVRYGNDCFGGRLVVRTRIVLW